MAFAMLIRRFPFPALAVLGVSILPACATPGEHASPGDVSIERWRELQRVAQQNWRSWNVPGPWYPYPEIPWIHQDLDGYSSKLPGNWEVDRRNDPAFEALEAICSLERERGAGITPYFKGPGVYMSSVARLGDGALVAYVETRWESGSAGCELVYFQIGEDGRLVTQDGHWSIGYGKCGFWECPETVYFYPDGSSEDEQWGDVAFEIWMDSILEWDYEGKGGNWDRFPKADVPLIYQQDPTSTCIPYLGPGASDRSKVVLRQLEAHCQTIAKQLEQPLVRRAPGVFLSPMIELDPYHRACFVEWRMDGKTVRLGYALAEYNSTSRWGNDWVTTFQPLTLEYTHPHHRADR